MDPHNPKHLRPPQEREARRGNPVEDFPIGYPLSFESFFRVIRVPDSPSRE
jgi:hypothetical protein